MKRMIKIILVLIIIYILAILILFFLQEKIVFHNVKLPTSYVFSFQQKFEEVHLNTTDKKVLNALHFKVENPKGVLLYFHGNAGNLDRWGTITSYFTKFNYDVFVVDYRSYGKSTGDFDEKRMYEDAQLCYDYLKERYSENEISLYGRSLGCTFAIKVASQNKPKQLILEAPFYNLKNVAKYHYPYVPYGLLLKYKFNSDIYIKNVTCKTTIFHGTNDKVIPIKSSEKLMKLANNKTTYIAVKDGTHHNLFNFKNYQKTITEILK